MSEILRTSIKPFCSSTFKEKMMKNFIKTVSFFVLVFFGQQAFSACWTNSNQIPPGTPPLFLQNGMWCTQQQQGGLVQGGGGQVFVQHVSSQQQQVFAPPPNAIFVPTGSPVPQTHCSWEGRFVNIAASGAIGAVVGALIGDNQRAAGRGAAAGALAGVFVPCNQQQQVQQVQQVVSQGTAQQLVVVQTPQTVAVQARTPVPPPPPGNWPCNFAINGKITESVMTTNDVVCRSWTDAKAASMGLIPIR